MKIPVCSPYTTENEIKWVNKALQDNAISSNYGGYVKKFEDEFAKKIGTKYAVAVNSGTSALIIALKALGLGEGDEVITTDFTMISTVNAIELIGATPVLVDANYEDMNINVDKIEDAITPKTKAIIPVHIYGQPCEMDKIMDIADKYQLKVIEDAAEAHGAEYKGKLVGGIGDVGCFSFYANKIITTGEGGMITTNDKEVADEARLLRACYFYPKYHFWHRKPAYNMRMSSLCAAYGIGQLERWDELIGNRIYNAGYYTDGFKILEGQDLVILPKENEDTKNVFWMYTLRVREKDRDNLMEYLDKNDIETRTGFYSCHKQPPYKREGDFDDTELLEKQTLYLPSSSDLDEQELDYIIATVKKYFDEEKKSSHSDIESGLSTSRTGSVTYRYIR